jgi:hypothetical protein
VDKNLNEAQETLLSLMGELSDRYWSAHWLMDLEYYLWYAVQHGPKLYGFVIFDREDIDTLSRLSQEAGGWFWWSEATHSVQFLPLEKWEQRYATWVVQRAEKYEKPTGVSTHYAYTFDPAAFHRRFEGQVVSHHQVRLDALQSLAASVVANASQETRQVLRVFRFSTLWLDRSDNEHADAARWSVIALAEQLLPAPSLNNRGVGSFFALYSLVELAGWKMNEVLALLYGQPLTTFLESSPLSLPSSKISSIDLAIGWLDVESIKQLYNRLLQAENAFVFAPAEVLKALEHLASLWKQSPAELLGQAYADAREMLETALARRQALILVLY